MYSLSIVYTNLSCLASNVPGKSPFSLALPPHYNTTWWLTQRNPNGSLLGQISKNFTEDADRKFGQDKTTVELNPLGGPHSIKVSTTKKN